MPKTGHTDSATPSQEILPKSLFTSNSSDSVSFSPFPLDPSPSPASCLHGPAVSPVPSLCDRGKAVYAVGSEAIVMASLE